MKPKYRYSWAMGRWEQVFTVNIPDYFILIGDNGKSSRLPMYLYDAYKNIVK